MVRFDIVGINDCPWFAKAVKLGEEVSAAHPRVEFHHEMLDKYHFHVCNIMFLKSLQNSICIHSFA